MRCRFYQWTLDLDNHQLFQLDDSVNIRPKAFKLLAFLALNARRLVTREEVIDYVWQGRCVCDESLTTCIKEVRKILKDNEREKKYIVTRHGLGYQFLPHVIVEEPNVEPFVYHRGHEGHAAAV